MAGAGEGAGCPGRGGWPGRASARGARDAAVGPERTRARGAQDAAGWPGEMRPYRLPRHSAVPLLELLSAVREDHPKVVLE